MKTLKKTLCLVLAMVMVFGLCAVSASAKLEYTDNDDITYTEAVDVMTGIGILQGDERGFRPTDDITRAEAAKIITYMVIGNAKQADAYKASSDPFTDVPATHWAAGYIAYCASAGIIKGMGDGTYHPSDNVTGLQFATMLLRALGYGKNEEYEGADWAIYASRDAIRLGVFYNHLEGASATEKATREECALYAFNVIAGTKDYSGIQKVTYSSLVGDYITNGAFGGSSSTTVDANMKGTFGADYELNHTRDNADEYDKFGRVDGYYWYVGKQSNRVTDYYINGNKLKNVYTTGVTGAEIGTLLGLSASDLEKAKLTVIMDGKELTEEPEGTKADAKWTTDNFKKGKTETLYGTGNGVETTVYEWTTTKDGKDTHNIRVCIVNTYMVKVSSVTKATATKDANTKVKKLDEEVQKFNLDTKGFETDVFAKNEYVLITVADGAIQSMASVDVKEAEVTRYTKNGSKITIVIDGQTCSTAKNVVDPDTTDANAVAGDKIENSIVDGKEHKIYLDEYGYVIGAAKVAAESNYVYVSHFGTKTDNSGDFNSNSIGAKVYYADGTSEVLTVKSVKIGDADAVDKYAGLSTGIGSDGNIKPDVYKLTMDDGKAVLECATAITDGGKVNKGFDKTTGTSDSFDGKTVFFYVKVKDNGDAIDWNSKDFEVTAYTGINNVPTAKDGETTLISAIAKDAVVKAALVNCKFGNKDGDTVYFFRGSDEKGNYTRDGQTTVIYKVYASGATEATDLELTYGKADDAKTAIGKCDKANFYTVNSKNELTKVVSGTKDGKITYVLATAKDVSAYMLKASYTNETKADDAEDRDVTDKALTLANANIVDLRDVTEPVTDAAGLKDAAAGTDKLCYFISFNESDQIVDLYVFFDTSEDAPAEGNEEA